jgi:hypothetical protein
MIRRILLLGALLLLSACSPFKPQVETEEAVTDIERLRPPGPYLEIPDEDEEDVVELRVGTESSQSATGAAVIHE